MIDGGSAAYHRSRCHVLRDAALGDGYGAVSDFYVAADAYLSGENHVVAYIGGARQAHLGAEQGVVADGATVTYMHHVVDFRSASDAGLADAGAIDTGIGLDLGVASDDDVSGLNDFMPVPFVIFGEAEAVGADDGSVLQENVVAQLTELSDYGMSVGEEIVANGGSAIDDRVGEQDGVVSDDDVFVDDHVSANVRVLADFCGVMDDGGGMDSGSVVGRMVEEFERFGPGEIWIVAAQHAGGEGGEALGDDDGGGFRYFGGSIVFGIRDEGELAFFGLLDAG